MSGNYDIFGMEKMISKLAKAQNSWIVKIIFAAVALSFVSLFGVTGYIDSASQNQTVIDVDGKKTTQHEFSYRLQKEMSLLKNLSGEDFEITDEMRTALIEGVLKQIINESVLDQTMKKLQIYFPKNLVQQVIFSQSEFANPANGQFHPELFKRYLAAANMSEEEYVAGVKRMLARKMLISDMTETFNVPVVLSQAIHKMDNQRKTFKYVLIAPDDMVIERVISDDEIKQYYEDFADNFMVPETRDADVLFVPNEVILSKYAASEEMIADYYEEHKKEFDIPEKREILQMVFTDKATAEKAFAEVKNGKDFKAAAQEFKAENADAPTLGLVAEDELAEALADKAFALDAGKPELVEVADSWQVISVKDIQPAKEATFEESKEQIATLLKNENLYDAVREAKAAIDDTINGGKALTDAGEIFGIAPIKLKDIREDQIVSDAPAALKNLVSSLDFNELAFSYGLDEITSAEEFDDGIAVLQVMKITDAHLPEIADVKPQIIDLWKVQEKNALAKETAENIVADVEDGSDLSQAAKARGLEAFRSEPISRNDSFAGLSTAEVRDLFRTEDNAVKLFEHNGNTFVVAKALETVNYADELGEETLKEIKKRATNSLLGDLEESALNSYAENFKIKIDYKRAGFAE